MPPRLFLASPYHTGSHKAWAEGYMRHSAHDVKLITMAGRFWKWRMQGGAIELVHQIKHVVAQSGRADALLVTDMVNLPALIALARPWLNDTPVLYYLHENQLTYPPPPGEKRDLTYGMINTLSMLCADTIAFNSQYHYDDFFAELLRLLKHFPDYNHREIIPTLQEKSVILPVGLDLSSFQPSPSIPSSGPLRILWNQRWEYDKNPGAFFAALYRLQELNLPFQVIVTGKNFRRQPREFMKAKQRLKERIFHWGYVPERKDYLQLLQQADIVVSTAFHEFFGISVLEAIYCRCYPLLPQRLSYPELLPASLHKEHLYRDFDELVAKLRWAIHHIDVIRTTDRRHIAAGYDWSELAPRYDALISQLIAAAQERHSTNLV